MDTVHSEMERFIIKCSHFTTQKCGIFFNHDPLRNRKLLLHKKEILKLKSNTEKRNDIVPLSLYLKGSG